MCVESGDELDSVLVRPMVSTVEEGAFIRDITGCYEVVVETGHDAVVAALVNFG